jgi:transposase
LHASYREVIKLGYEENPTLADHGGGQHERTKAQNLLLGLDHGEVEVLRFAYDFRMPFDNHLSVKLQQKISGCWRSSAGAERFLAIRSYLSTARNQGAPRRSEWVVTFPSL